MKAAVLTSFDAPPSYGDFPAPTPETLPLSDVATAWARQAAGSGAKLIVTPR
jgi:hypothetical protein